MSSEVENPFKRGIAAALRPLCLTGMILALSACGKDEDQAEGQAPQVSTNACVPADSLRATFKPFGEVKRASKIAIYVDGSQSMSGFANATTRELRAIGDLVTLLQARASNYEEASFHAFGKSIREISSNELNAYGTPQPYNCRGCDNQESRLDNVLNAAAAAGSDTLSVIITDLWLDNKSFVGSPQVALGEPLRAALAEGLSVGVIGIQAPFDGAVYDVPGVGTYRGASSLPLYVLAIGPEEDVASLEIAFKQSGARSFDDARMRYSLFSKEPNNPFVNVSLRSVGAGASRGIVNRHPSLKSLPQYVLDVDVARAQKGMLGRTIPIDANLREGLVWRADLAERTDAWRLVSKDALSTCSKDAWQSLSEISDLWEERDGGEKATFSFDHRISEKLVPGNIYYVETHLGSNEVGVPNAANQWMRDWALNADNAPTLVQQGEGPFKTLNLSDLAQILEQELARQAEGGREVASFGFLLKVER